MIILNNIYVNIDNVHYYKYKFNVMKVYIIVYYTANYLKLFK